MRAEDRRGTLRREIGGCDVVFDCESERFRIGVGWRSGRGRDDAFFIQSVTSGMHMMEIVRTRVDKVVPAAGGAVLATL